MPNVKVAWFIWQTGNGGFCCCWILDFLLRHHQHASRWKSAWQKQPRRSVRQTWSRHPFLCSQSPRPLWALQLWEQLPLVFLSQLECPHENQPCSGNFPKHEASTADESTTSASSAPLDEWNLAPVRSLGSNPHEHWQCNRFDPLLYIQLSCSGLEDWLFPLELCWRDLVCTWKLELGSCETLAMWNAGLERFQRVLVWVILVEVPSGRLDIVLDGLRTDHGLSLSWVSNHSKRHMKDSRGLSTLRKWLIAGAVQTWFAQLKGRARACQWNL